MNSLWNDEEAARHPGDLGQRVYSSRLLGRDRTLVLHGGGNTSVKVVERDVLGQDVGVLYVKGSGWDLATIEAAGFTPVRLDHLRRLAQLPALSDTAMVNELVTHQLRASAPTPSVEAILHALLPHKYVDHTHADAVIAVTNTKDGEQRVRDIYGSDVVVVPYVMPGFELARACAQCLAEQAHAGTVGMVLLNHGIFSFGESARQSYERMIELVGRAERHLQGHGAARFSAAPAEPVSGPDVGMPGPAPAVPRETIARLRAGISRVAGFPMVLTRRADERALAFVRRADVAHLALQGPATPDHVLRTKRLPMLGRDGAAYAQAYAGYFEEHAARAAEPRTMLDPAPRIVLDGALGLCALGRSARDAAIAAEIYEHTIDIILAATALGGYHALPAREIFAVEYWDLEQAKLRRSGKPPAFAGEVALVTGAASGIGLACVDSLLGRGAAVVGLDVNGSVTTVHDRPDYLGLTCDVTDEAAVGRALDCAVYTFGGLDMLVLNAGIFNAGTRIEELAGDAWRRVMQVNLDANLTLLRESHALLRCAPGGGRVVVIGSKNVPAPGPGAAAYSASKAALAQLARVAALEWGRDGIRVNMLHPNAVFDTGLWTAEVLQERARQYGMTVEQYRRNNVLGVEVTSRDVAELAAELCGPAFARTTGAQIAVDGGNDRVI